jgi:hypothetical protein
MSGRAYSGCQVVSAWFGEATIARDSQRRRPDQETSMRIDRKHERALEVKRWGQLTGIK